MDDALKGIPRLSACYKTNDESEESAGITLFEALVAVVLLLIIIVTLNSINLFGHFQVLSSSRRARIQNDATILLNHMERQVAGAIGNEAISGADSVVIVDVHSPNQNKDYISFLTDTDQDGAGDTWKSYQWRTTKEIFFCPQCNTPACPACPGNADVLVAENITAFSGAKPGNPLADSFITVSITKCWNPAGTCGTLDNPQVAMNTTLRLPMVSTH